MNLTSGIMPVRRNLDYGLTISIASDVGAGHVPDINHHIVQSIEASKMLSMLPEHQGERPLLLPEAFYMATKAGGSFFGRVGSFEPGYDFDALVIREDDNPLGLSPQERLERYIYAGDDRSITHRFVAGREIPLPFPDIA
jgi:guanine deaminase